MNNISIEFLSVYEPSLQELKQPLIFADNVQQLMSRHLQKEATDISSNMKWKYGGAVRLQRHQILYGSPSMIKQPVK